MQIIKYGKWYLIASLIILVPGIISLFVWGLNLAIDFTGGSNFEYRISRQEKRDDEILKIFRDEFAAVNTGIERISVTNDIVEVTSKPVDTNKAEELKTALAKKLGKADVLYYETVGPSMGSETAKNSLVALGVASLGILLYIAFAFRNIPKPYSSFRFGISAIIAMLHDAFMVIGIFSILGHFFKIEIDTLFITAVLTVIGFSVHDTIVVFDRIRENLRKLPGTWSFESIVNYSVVETLNRSLATSLTVIITLFALLMLGGESIRYFTLALLIGIFSGTYSSIFTASPILVIWEKMKRK